MSRRKQLMKISAEALSRWVGGETQDEVLDWAKHALRVPTEDAEAARALAAMGIMWAMKGFPTVGTTHRLAASLMASVVPAESVAHVELPWSQFAIAIPDGLLDWCGMPVHYVFVDYAGGPIAAHKQGFLGSLVADEQGFLGSFLYFQDEVTGAVFGAQFGAVSDLCHTVDTTGANPRMKSDDAAHDRLRTMINRIVVGVCVELDQPKHRVVISNGPPPPSAKHAKRGEPKAWMFQLTRDVKVDCREWVTSYLRGDEGTRPSVQSLVRGHHKRQPCGPEGKDRKWIHVEPYWRGPEDAPIAVRSHVLQ